MGYYDDFVAPDAFFREHRVRSSRSQRYNARQGKRHVQGAFGCGAEVRLETDFSKVTCQDCLASIATKGGKGYLPYGVPFTGFPPMTLPFEKVSEETFEEENTNEGDGLFSEAQLRWMTKVVHRYWSRHSEVINRFEEDCHE